MVMTMMLMMMLTLMLMAKMMTQTTPIEMKQRSMVCLMLGERGDGSRHGVRNRQVNEATC
eukprot:6945487-Pyramimonas_sp.AAC.1